MEVDAVLVFISDYPNQENIRDGFMQRVCAIDKLVQDKQRIYLSISLRRNMTKRVKTIGKLKIYNLDLFLHFKTIRKILKSARIIYAHSIINWSKICFFPVFEKTVLDIHGVVPEESVLRKKRFTAKIYNIVEKKLF